jgi:integrase/recombinase XerD
LNKVVVEFLEANKDKSEQTLRTYRYTLEQFNDWVTEAGGDITNLTRFDVQQYVTHLENNGKSASTIHKTVSIIGAYARWSGRGEAVEALNLPVKRKLKHIAPKSLERNDKNKVLRDVEKDGKVRDIAIVYTLLHTGLRVSELVGLNMSDVEINERSGSLTVRHGKGNVERIVPLSKEVRHHLSRYINQRNSEQEALFLSFYNQRISVRAVQHIVKKYDIHPHMLRHTFARTLVSNGVDVPTVAELLGHASLETTMRYSRPNMNDLTKAIDRSF